MFQNEQRITITARDLKVVSALQCDGRMTMQALADKVGISVYAATESYRRLIESGIMNIVPVCNPLSLGNYSQVLVGLRLDGSRDEALAMLQSMPQVTYVVCALGDADIIAEAVVYSAEGMDHFLKHGLRALPGLSRLQVFSCGRLVLDDHNVSVVNRLLAAHGETGFLTKREASVGTDIPSPSSGSTVRAHIQRTAEGRQGQLCVVGGASRRDPYGDSRPHQKTRRFRRDAHYGHGKPHAFGRIPTGIPRTWSETSVSA